MSEQIVKEILSKILIDSFKEAEDLPPIQDKSSNLLENIEKNKKENEIVPKVVCYKKKMDFLQNNVLQMTNALNCLKLEFNSLQIEKYREKFIKAQQKVEEQSIRMESMEMNSRQIEDKVNIEIKRIKTKLEESQNQVLSLKKHIHNQCSVKGLCRGGN